ncbi:stimulated by retinoic acid gene 6 protein homolog [Plakobranchus ocellatus]|uniref:Stimulated by retinoic acid gene 6 protein homolog n=1 Tax=Plakobranchus ocellatus TaxID=259542 RepID=A0AAV4BU93_9GAST|nr:stimulated by retinoic acid gene 6 protein homolog [Plakobranchus ocellatus]
MFFYNIFLGLVSCLLRIIKAIAIGTIFLARLDNSTLPRKFKFFDPGLSAYIGYIHMEAAHTHPVVNVFIRLLESMSQARRQNQKGSTVEMNEAGGNGSATKSDDAGKKAPPLNVSARFNWLVVYTLLNNPQVRMYRKGYFQALKIARREGLKVPISDLPISDFDLAKLQKETEEEKQAQNAAKACKYNCRGINKGISNIMYNFRDMKLEKEENVEMSEIAQQVNGDLKTAEKSTKEDKVKTADGDADLGDAEPEQPLSGRANDGYVVQIEGLENNESVMMDVIKTPAGVV